MKVVSIIFVSLFLFGCASSQRVDGIQRQVNAVGDVARLNQEGLKKFANNVAKNESEQDVKINSLENRVLELEDRVSRMNSVLDRKFVNNSSK